MAPLLELNGVTKRYAGVVAVDDLAFAVPEGEVLGVIGPNGAGKSTLLSLVAGAQRPTSGSILFAGRHRIDRLRTHAVARLGIARAHQVPRPFHGMTVRQNVLVAAQASGRSARGQAALAEDVCRLCGIPEPDRPVESLRLLELKRLGVARALALEPRLLLLDEVAAGLVGDEVTEVVDLVRAVHARGVTVILVEHVQSVIQQLAQRVLVLDWGRRLAEGTPAQVAADPQVARVYLGDDAGAAAPALRGRLARADAAPAAPVLEVEDLTVDYGKARALHGVGLTVREGELVAVVGANGAGKTSLALAIAGMVRATSGAIRLGGDDVTRTSAHARARAGVALCHEGRQLFTELTVEENLLLPTDHVHRPGPPVAERLERVYELFPILRDRRAAPAGALSGGQQQMVAIGRALMPQPRLVIFDELSLGLAPRVVDEIFAVIPRVLDWGAAVLLIEQNVHRSLEVCDRAYVMERGRVAMSGRADELDDVQDAYFGGRALTTGGERDAR